MPKHLSLFGKYLRNAGKAQKKLFDKRQISKLIPVKAYGRPPSASSQTGLYHDEDFNYFSKISFGLQSVRRKIKPMVFKKDFYSEALNTKIENLRVTTSALHAMDDVGGLDAYLLRTPPQDLRSHLGERMRNVIYFYKENPEIRQWGLPWKVFLRQANQNDPYYARYKHMAGMEFYEKYKRRTIAHFSPYYLPPLHELLPERQPFLAENAEEKDVFPSSLSSGEASSSSPQPLNLWWKQSPELTSAFRRRLGEAKGFERTHASHKEKSGYRKGEGRGGGGQHGSTLRLRSKTYKYRQTRPY